VPVWGNRRFDETFITIITGWQSAGQAPERRPTMAGTLLPEHAQRSPSHVASTNALRQSLCTLLVESTGLFSTVSGCLAKGSNPTFLSRNSISASE
jgi:hypothetical protein